MKNKLITVDGQDYILTKGRYKGWDLRFNDLLILGYTIKEIINIIKKDGGCFNYRLMRGSTKTLSKHSWGIAKN